MSYHQNKFPERWDYFPIDWKDNNKIPPLTIREAAPSDTYAISVIEKSHEEPGASLKRIYRWITTSLYSVWVAVRNHRHVTGYVVAKHDPVTRQSTILRIYVHPEARRQKIATRLMAMVSFEQPEYSLRVTRNFEEAYELEGFFRSLGFKRDDKFSNEDDKDLSSFTLASRIAGLKPPAE
jgi:ribosomal protein S18 acetylase RimI-like enzyme